MKETCIEFVAAVGIGCVALPAPAQNVKITPLGSHAGALCDGQGHCAAGCE